MKQNIDDNSETGLAQSEETAAKVVDAPETVNTAALTEEDQANAPSTESHEEVEGKLEENTSGHEEPVKETTGFGPAWEAAKEGHAIARDRQDKFYHIEQMRLYVTDVFGNSKEISGIPVIDALQNDWYVK